MRTLLKILIASLLAGCGSAPGQAGKGLFSALGFGTEDGAHAAQVPATFPASVASALASHPTSNNDVRVFPDREGFPELQQMFQGARRSLWIETFTWHYDEPGLRLADVVARKKAEGLDVHVLIDHFGQGEAIGDRAIFDWFKRHGVDVRWYQSRAIFPRGFMHFSHRKLYMVDGQSAMTGGMNIGHEYESIWHDLLVRVDGELAHDIHGEFQKDWERSGGQKLAAPALPDKEFGRHTAAAIATSMLEAGRTDEIHRVLLGAIDGATKRVYCGYPYWGDQALVDHLKLAVGRGVEVRVILPFENDTDLFRRANKFIVADLLSRGVHVRWWTKGFAHAKYMVVDAMSEIGSSNADTSSFENQQEMDLLTCDPEVTRRFVEAVPEADWQGATREVAAEDLGDTLGEKPEDTLLKVFQRYL